MKKFFYAVFILIAVFIMVLYGILFTSFGNSFVANIAQSKIKESSGLDVNITRFDLRFSSINLQLNLENMVNLDLYGKLNLFKLGFDLNYAIKFDKSYAQNLGLNLKENLVFGGKIQGKASDFIADGKGYLFGSDVLLDTRIYDYSPIALNLSAQSMQISELLGLLGKTNLAKGTLDIASKITAKDLKPDGNIIIKLDNTYINYEKFKKEFGIDLPENSNLKAQILANIKEDKVYIVSKIYNGYLNLQTQKTLYNLSNNTLFTDFDLKIPSLAKLEKLTKTKLNGDLQTIGDLSLANNALQALNANIIGLGGEIKASLKNNQLLAQIDSADLGKILAIAGYGSLINGNLNANLSSTGLDFANFNAEAKIDNAKINTQELKKNAHIELPSTTFSFDAKALAKNNNITYNAILASNLLNIKKLSGNYNLKNGELNTDLNSFIDDLSQFSAIAGQKLQGNVQLNAKAHIIGSKIQNLSADANIADGIIKASSDGEKLDLNINKLDLSKILVIAGMPNYASGDINAKAHLDSVDLKNLNGNINLNAKGILNSVVLGKILNKKFPSNINYDLKSNVVLKNSIAEFDSVLNSTLANLSHLKGSFDINKINLKSNFNLDVNDFSKLGFLLDRKLKGSASFNGDINYDKTLNFNIMSKNLFNGTLNAILKNNIINADLNNVDLDTLAQGIDIMDVYQGKANVKANYNILNEQGEVNLDVKQGKLKPNSITKALKALTLKDFTQEVFHTANAKALINKENIKLNLNMQADNASIVINSGELNSKSGSLNLPFSAKIDKADFKGNIAGTTDNPKIKLDVGSVVDSVKNILGVKNNDAKDTDKNKKVDKAINKLLNKIF
ncbi:translocation/assembly module TamB domain-containing protein [Campylobacter estrildidarum]|uniref:DUF3971 domain-containing protein n=1 Tax=Campylobacter estrildidarum TaxID=2510189 RepID=A0A4U7BIU4_9BACT|nr:hypothetical protein [Campylobacter estrildidarum]TKX31773.1 hypothetical protein CQA69_01735 [Campylobacter estrildidarum]